eukprot:9144672-Lingulodinium_polyedra.AAC.1
MLAHPTSFCPIAVSVCHGRRRVGAARTRPMGQVAVGVGMRTRDSAPTNLPRGRGAEGGWSSQQHFEKRRGYLA